MDLEKLLNTPLLRNLRTAVATIRAIMFAVAVGGGSVVLIVLSARYFAVDPEVTIALVVLLLVLLAGSVYAWLFVTRTYDPTFYEIESIDGRLVVDVKGEHHLYTYTREQEVVATRNKLRLIEIRAHWTGKGNRGTTHVESLFPEHVLLDGKRREEDGRIYRWIYPRRPLRRGRGIKVGLRQTHEDDVERQLPYYREGGGRYKTKRITVTVRLPLSVHAPESVRGVVWASPSGSIQSEPVDDLSIMNPRVDRNAGFAEYTVVANRPRRLQSYGIEWVWTDDPLD